MGIGLFGKLPQRADFVAVNLPPTILHPLEQWLEAGVAQSRTILGEHWLEAYLVAPIWRLWIGPEVFGHACCGALMPSVDAVGRYFPLLLLAWSADESAPPPPQQDPADAWYESIEARLLSVLQAGQLPDLAAVTAGLEALATGSIPAAKAAQSYWWRDAADPIITHAGLPPAKFYAELLRPTSE